MINQYINNLQDQSLALKLSINGIIPYKEYEVDPNIKYKVKYQDRQDDFADIVVITIQQTIYEILDANQVPIPHHWNKNGLQTNLNKEQYKVFDQACYGQIPKLENNKPEMQNDKGWTVAMILAYNNIDIPKEWYHNPNIQNSYGQTVAMIMFDRCKDVSQLQIPQQWLHNPELQDRQEQYQFRERRYGFTMAMRYAYMGIVPPKQWNHKSDIYGQIQDDDQYYYNGNVTVAMLLVKNCIIPPQQWQHDSSLVGNNYLMTVAMILVQNNIEPPNEWIHDTKLQDKNGFTVALLQAQDGKIPDKQWQHNKFIRAKCYDSRFECFKCYTVQNFLQFQSIKVPEEWKYANIIDDSENTKAMKQASQGKIPDQKYYHDPQQTNLRNDTVALLLSQNGIIPPNQWQHDKLITDVNDYTVAEMLSKKCIIPPDCWMIQEKEDKQRFQNIQNNLQSCNYSMKQ